MTRIRSWYLRRPVVAVLWTTVAAMVLLLGVLGAAQASDQPTFCASCHEMTPYYDAWSEGAHADISCVACHVDAGLTDRVSHKVVALGEVWKHVTEDPTFPLPEPPPVPDERCMACHESVDIDISGRTHAEHAGDKSCAQCHATVGHDVSNASLIEADIFNPAAAEARARLVVASVGQGADNIEGHVTTRCSSCHDMQTVGCENCHTPTHEQKTETCSVCHAAAAEWLFTHPSEGACESCHAVPDGHTTIATDKTCESCHSQIGESWAFAHPGTDSTCTSCHSTPSDHRSGSCTSCHATGRSWAFKHPGSSACASCHKAPSSHYGSSCSSCHSSARSWSSASFRHPGVPGGEHSYRSFSCTSCHPSGYSSYSCTTCHGAEGPDDDDD